MTLTKTQAQTKQHIVAFLLADKEESLSSLLKMQRLDNQEAKVAMEQTHNIFEDGKVDQARNRVTARSSVADALQAEIKILKGIDSILPTAEVQLGDVIETNHGKFFAAVPSDEFTIEGESYRGISTDSPLFQALLGKKNGDEVNVNGQTYRLLSSF